MVKDLKIEDFDYNLPEKAIALHPLAERDECKLLLRTPEGRLYHRIFKELPDLLPPGALLVCNDTKVINARMEFHKETGAGIELFLLEPVEPSDYALNFQSRKSCVWKCLVGNSKKWKDGEIFKELEDSGEKVRIKARRLENLEEGGSNILFSWDENLEFGKMLELCGTIPIPPYLNRESEASDKEDYQTIYAREDGSVAAPTAGLHFTPKVFEGLEAHAVEVQKLTLHVGAGTFRPVKSESIGEHAMHSEPFTVTRKLIEKLIEFKEEGRPVVAVGTTSVRCLESLPYIGKSIGSGKSGDFYVDQWAPYTGEDFSTLESLRNILGKMKEEGSETLTASTSIMIAPGFQWRIVDCMVTNFHQPKSTLLLLVSSFTGGDDWKNFYKEALEKGYRFLSYGDACLLLRNI